MSGRHPGHDVLADLAAEVLPEHEARLVEAHVIGCETCADLLGEAERVRQLLLTADPGPMPAHVWDRLARTLGEAALTADPAPTSRSQNPAGLSPLVSPVAAAPAAGLQTGHGGADRTVPHADQDPAAASYGPPTDQWLTSEWPTVGADHGAPDGGGPVVPEFEDAPTAQWQSFADEEPPAWGDPDDVRGADPFPVGARPDPDGASATGRNRRTGSVSALRSRRQVRSEDRSMSRLKLARPIAMAAAAALVIGGAVFAVVQLPLGGSDDASTTAGAGASAEADRAAGAAGDAPAGAEEAAGASVIAATGTNYTEADLAEKALALAPQNDSSTPSAAGRASAASTSPASPGVLDAQGTSPSPAAGQVPSVAGNAALTNEARLEECLAQLNAGGDQPIVVDFARFENKDAVIIVLASRSGGYEVWAVSRTCGPQGADEFAYLTVPAG